eukprot:7268034-Pyramimonas_sp.AAC.1
MMRGTDGGRVQTALPGGTTTNCRRLNHSMQGRSLQTPDDVNAGPLTAEGRSGSPKAWLTAAPDPHFQLAASDAHSLRLTQFGGTMQALTKAGSRSCAEEEG